MVTKKTQEKTEERTQSAKAGGRLARQSDAEHSPAKMMDSTADVSEDDLKQAAGKRAKTKPANERKEAAKARVKQRHHASRSFKAAHRHREQPEHAGI
jgi:hypothetical protein